jgi:predicted Na+-dependent transporter
MPVLSLEPVARFSIFVFVVTNMLNVGLGLSVLEILEPLKSARLVFSALAANFVLVPALTYFIVKTIPLDQPLSIAMLLLGTGAGAPFAPKLTEFARGNLAFAVGLMVLLMAGTVIYMPIVFPLLLPSARVGSWLVAKPLVTLMLMPLTLGLLIRARRPTLASRFQPYARNTSTIALVIGISLVFAANYHRITQILSFNVVLAGASLLLISLCCGFVLGGPSADTRSVMAFGTAQRDLSAALLVASNNFVEMDVIVMLTVVALLGLCIQIPLAVVLGNRAKKFAVADWPSGSGVASSRAVR